MKKALVWSAALAATVLACGSTEEAAGTVFFTASAGSAVETDGPALADGWAIHYDRFVVTFHDLAMRNGTDAPAARLLGARLLDLKPAGTKRIATFDNLAAGSFSRITYRIAPVTDDTDVGAGATAEDKQLMLAGGYGIYLEATATNGAARKYLRWGFPLDTTYDECRTAALVTGAVVADATATEIGLAIDALALYPDGFAPIAAADTNGDQIVDLAELSPDLLARVQTGARALGRFHDGGTCVATAN